MYLCVLNEKRTPPAIISKYSFQIIFEEKSIGDIIFVKIHDPAKKPLTKKQNKNRSRKGKAKKMTG
jgi:hypothetical protein